MKPSLSHELNRLQADLRKVTAGVHALINAVRKGRRAGPASKTKPSARRHARVRA